MSSLLDEDDWLNPESSYHPVDAVHYFINTQMEDENDNYKFVLPDIKHKDPITSFANDHESRYKLRPRKSSAGEQGLADVNVQIVNEIKFPKKGTKRGKPDIEENETFEEFAILESNHSFIAKEKTKNQKHNTRKNGKKKVKVKHENHGPYPTTDAISTDDSPRFFPGSDDSNSGASIPFPTVAPIFSEHSDGRGFYTYPSYLPLTHRSIGSALPPDAIDSSGPSPQQWEGILKCATPMGKTRAKWWWLLQAERTKLNIPMPPPSEPTSPKGVKLPPRSKLKELLQWAQTLGSSTTNFS